MKKLLLLIAVSLLFSSMVFAQETGVLRGYVKDSKNGKALPAAHVTSEQGKGTLTDKNGEYQLILNTGNHLIRAQFIGFTESTERVSISNNDTINVDFLLKPSIEQLEEIVISAEKTEQKITDVNVSMSILKPKQIERVSATSIAQVLKQQPGLEILDGQPSIRGGSGFSYGAGSRVLVLVDGLPLISGDAGHVQWSFLPMENLSQVEIIKGASSVLYGSSALNGIISFRYKDPGEDPKTSLRTFAGTYMAPKRKELLWWDSPRWFAGNSLTHTRKAGNLDITTGAYVFQDKGYREDEYNKHVRLNAKLRYKSKSFSGLSYGLNTSGMTTNQGDFFLWQNADSGAYLQNPSGTSFNRGKRFYIDPSIRYLTSKGGRHTLKTRYYGVSNGMPDNPDKNSRFYLLLGEYQYQKRFTENISWTIGSSINFSNVHSNLYGQHSKSEAAVFTQLSTRILSRIKYNIGFRWETYRLDELTENSRPVFRSGINYQLFPHTFLRLSAGQGYRFPSIAEKHTATQVGALNIFPNPELESESAWSADFGIVQGYQLGSLRGFLDFSLFRSKYVNMIEYTFGLYVPEGVIIPSLDHVGFKALNVGNAQISGLEVILNAEKRIGNFKTNFQAGYTYINPIDLNIEQDSSNGILKYRFKHSTKVDAMVSWKKLSVGATLISNSFMENVDSVFTDPLFGNIILPGYPKYREEHQKGYTTLDCYTSYDFSQKTSLSFTCKNIFNVEYMGRPGDIQAHRSLILQFLLRL